MLDDLPTCLDESWVVRYEDGGFGNTASLSGQPEGVDRCTPLLFTDGKSELSTKSSRKTKARILQALPQYKIYIYIYIFIFIYIYVCVCMCIYIYIHTSIYIYIYIYMCVCVCVSVCLHSRMPVCLPACLPSSLSAHPSGSL